MVSKDVPCDVMLSLHHDKIIGNMPTPQLQCPFCERTSSAIQGLFAHVRNTHKKQYPKWAKDPSRFQPVEAKPAPVKSKPIPPKPPAAVTEPVPVADPVVSAPMTGDGALGLLNQARQQLVDRKAAIESELAKMDRLKSELERVDAQIKSLDGALGVFTTA
jgi:hypothetical protein